MGVALLRYSLLRLAVLVGSLAVLYLVGARGWLWLLLSVIVAGGVSYLVFPRQRDAAAGTLQERARARREQTGMGDVDAEVEDAAIDAASVDAPSTDTEGTDGGDSAASDGDRSGTA